MRGNVPNSIVLEYAGIMNNSPFKFSGINVTPSNNNALIPNWVKIRILENATPVKATARRTLL